MNPNEKYGQTLALHNVTHDSNFIIGDYFLKNNSLVKELGVAPGVSLVYYPTNPRHTIYDKFRKSGPTGTGVVTVDLTNYEYIDLANVPAGYSWAISKTTSPYNLYFAWNNTGTDFNRIQINLLKARPDTETL